MSDRLTRKDIKRDEFAEAVEHAVDYAGQHVRTILWAAGGVLVAVLLGVAGWLWLQTRESRASEALTRAMQVYAAPVGVADPKPDDPAEPSFATEAARNAKAKELFRELGDHYGGSDAGKIADLYLGRMALAEGDGEAARSHWQKFIDESGDHLLAAEAQLNLIRLDRQEGRDEEVLQNLREMLDAPEPLLPKDVVLFELAVTYEDLGRESDALSAFERLAQEYPTSQYAGEAQQRAALLGGGDLAQLAGGRFPGN